MNNHPALAVFLGNPGNTYANTRHNAAWLFTDYLQRSVSINWQLKFKGSYAKGTFGSFDMILYKFHGYMNNSGVGTAEIAKYFHVDPSNILVFHDELDLIPGKYKFSTGGGLKGHNGLRSIHKTLGSNEFQRCAIGIGRPAHPGFSIADWVLSTFTESERASLEIAFQNIQSELMRTPS